MDFILAGFVGLVGGVTICILLILLSILVLGRKRH